MAHRLLEEDPPIQDDNDVLITSSDSDIIIETLRVYGSLYAASIALYCIMRKFFPHWYNIRSWAPGHESRLAKEHENGIISWMWKAFDVSDEDFLDECGMDALCFVRALRFGRHVSIAACLNAAWLLPLYATAEREEKNNYMTDPFSKLTTSNLPASSPRFVGTVISAYIFFLYCMYLIQAEYEWYTKWRHKFLMKKMPRNYAIYVSGVPSLYASSFKLAEYFRQCSSKEAVLEAHVAMDIPNLEAKVSKREKTIQKLEHTLALERKNGTKETRLVVGLRGVENVYAVDHLEKELESLNKEIEVTVQQIMMNNDRFRSRLKRGNSTRNLTGSFEETLDKEDLALHRLQSNQIEAERLAEEQKKMRARKGALNLSLQDGHVIGEAIPENYSLEDGHLDDHLDENLSTHSAPNKLGGIGSLGGTGSSKASSLGRDDSGRLSDSDASDRSGRRKRIKVVQSGAKAVAVTVGATGQTIVKGSRVAGQTIAKGSRAAGQTIARSSKVAGQSLAMGYGVASDAIKRAALDGISSVEALAPMAVFKTEGTPRNAGFVVFRTLYAAQTALQMVHHPKANVMEVIEAPDPQDIFWRNVGLTSKARRSGKLMALAASVMLCVFWAGPTAVIVSMTEITSLRETMPKLGAWVDEHPNSEPFVAQFSPLLLLIMNEVVLPELLKHFAAWEGHVASSMLEASLFLKLGFFMIIQTFFVSTISGGFAAEIANMASEPSEIIDFLANSLPQMSGYFTQFLLASTFLLQSFEVLRIYPLSVAFVRRFVGPHLTEKERKRSWGWFHTLEDPPDFWHAETFAQLILFYLVLFVYASIAPVISFFNVFCFTLAESGYRHQFIHNYPRRYETGGKLWKYFIQFTLGSMLIAQLTLIGLLALKQNKFAGPAMGPLVGLTALFVFYIENTYHRISTYLPTRDCVLTDYQRGEENDDMSFVIGEYLQPALQKKRVEVDYGENTTGEP